MKKSIFKMFLVPIVILMLVQSLFTMGILIFLRTTTTIKDYASGIMEQMVENRKNVLESDMTQKWASISEQENYINVRLGGFLESKDITLSQMLGSKDLSDEFLELILPSSLNLVEGSSTTGIYLVLTSGDIKKEGEYSGYFVRDSNPLVNDGSYTDLLMERGSKLLAREFNISLDIYWRSTFRMNGYGADCDQSYLYEPWMAAILHPNADIKDLGYWAEPFVLGTDKTNSHEMITYSVPLRYDGEVYGILGLEIGTSYLEDYLPASELNSKSYSGYMLALKNEDESYTPLTGTGLLYGLVDNIGETFSVTETSYSNLYVVEGAKMGKQKIYGAVYPMKLYSSYVPYDNTGWVLIGLNEETELYGIIRQIYMWMVIALFLGLIFGIAGVSYAVHRLTIPIKRLIGCISRGRNGLMEYRGSNITEIDEIYDVVDSLTKKQKEYEDELIEEAELYRQILETSKDVFFSYDIINGTLDIINSDTMAGRYDKAEFEKSFIKDVHIEDRSHVRKLLSDILDTWNIEFRVKTDEDGNYGWRRLTGKAVCDSEGRRFKIVGRFSNIDEQKKREIMERQRVAIDNVTGFYNYNSGMEVLDTMRLNKPHGALIYFDFVNIAQISEKNGIIFADMVLEEFGRIVTEYTGTDMLTMRFNCTGFVIWLENSDRREAESLTLNILERVRLSFAPEIFNLSLYAGITLGDMLLRACTLIRHAKQAEGYAYDNKLDKNYCFYEDVRDEGLPAYVPSGEQIIATEYAHNISITSLVISLFAKGGDFEAQMHLIFQKLGYYYEAKNVGLFIINADFKTIYTGYEWHRNGQEKERSVPIQYKNDELDEFAKLFEEDGYAAWGSSHFTDVHLLDVLCENGSDNGIAVPLYDDGSLIGVFVISDMSEKMLKNNDEVRKIIELASVLQGQLNQQRHDLASKAKSDFLSRMSHEIRTPMNGIIGMTQIALKNNSDTEKMTDCLKKINTSSEYLLGLINDILDMSKIESGKMRIEQSDFSMKELITTVCELINPQAAAKDIEFVKNIDFKHEWFVGDGLRISQVIINLLGNAVKFTPQKGTVTLTANETSDGFNSRIYVEVKDTGIGISPEDHDRIFRSFEQASPNTVSRKTGTGLGLSISSRLIKMMGSAIKLESAPGCGSRFSFAITLTLGNPVKDENENEALSFAGKRILVVEDNELNAEIAKSILEDCDFEVDIVNDGKQAVDRIYDTPPYTYDLVLMDIMMPVMDGLEATKIIRSMEREDLKSLPIVAMSANVFDDDLKKSVECGMNGHLSKPVEIDKMYRLLKNILG